MTIKTLQSIIAVAVILFAVTFSYAGNIDPDNRFAWNENTGWINFAPTGKNGVTVTDIAISGMVWSENMGWINFSPANSDGVINDGNGNLSGYAWSENSGWLNFDAVIIDPGTGLFSGAAWGENIGWVNFFTEGSANMVGTTWRKNGDINGDGELNLIDAILSMQITANISPTGNVHNAADVNENGKIGIEESVYILEKVTGIRE